MNKSIRSFGSALLLLCAVGAHAQTADSVTTGSSYKDQVFYSMENGVQGTSLNANWEIAFQISGYSSAILINDAGGVELYSVPGSTADSWSKPVDTTGMASWPRWYNSPKTWDAGAFNMDRDYNTGDFGWGEYNMLTHTVSGTTVYVIKLSNGSYKKIFIDGLTSGVYNFRHADLDGSNEVQETFDKKLFTGKNFGYYSISGKTQEDREPATTSWDITFGRYIDFVAAGPNTYMAYPVTGVRINKNVVAAAVIDVPVEESVAPDEALFSDTASTIGWNWKSFNMSTNTYDISDTKSYFVKSQAGNLYKIVFTGFTGSSTGRYIFTKQQITSTSVGEPGSTVGIMALHPNTASTGEAVKLLYSTEQSGQAVVAVYDLTGRQLLQQSLLAEAAGLHTSDLSTSNLRSGTYLVVLNINGATAHQYLVIH